VTKTRPERLKGVGGSDEVVVRNEVIEVRLMLGGVYLAPYGSQLTDDGRWKRCTEFGKLLFNPNNEVTVPLR
jgi:hypothetical protein